MHIKRDDTQVISITTLIALLSQDHFHPALSLPKTRYRGHCMFSYIIMHIVNILQHYISVLYILVERQI